MTLSQYRNSSSWLGAIQLGPKLMGLAEELPASEETGLSLHLRQLMVELPACVSADLVRGTDTRQAVAFRLQATLELIDRVYPALDTGGIRADTDSLVERLLSPEQFAASPETSPAPAVPAPEVPSAEPAAPAVPADTPVLPAEESVAPVTVPVTPDFAPTPPPASTEPTP